MTAPPAGALEACLALLEKATRGRWSQDTGGDITMDDGTTLFTRELPGGDSDVSFANADLVESAVNLLKDHGPALLAALRLREWRPIETAPKDGARALVFGEFAGEIGGPVGEMAIGVAAWMYGGSTDYAGYHWRAENTDAYSGWWRPTHWMPLPAPPTAADLARVLSATGDEAALP